MKVPFYFFTIFLGIILAVHLSMNGRVGSALANPRVGNAAVLVHRRIDRRAHRPHWLAFRRIERIERRSSTVADCWSVGGLPGIRNCLAAAPGRRSSHVHYVDCRTSAWGHDSFSLRLAGFARATDHPPQHRGSRGHDMRRGPGDLRQGGCIVVKRIKLGNSGLEVSALAMGSDLIGSKIDRQTAFKLFDFYRDKAARSLTRQTCTRVGCPVAKEERARPRLARG